GVVGFARECAHEYAQYGIRVHTLLPDEKRPFPPQQIAAKIIQLCHQPNDENIHRLNNKV
ncbi:MAG: hypothetical protein GY805_13935, partial [Chloroflexi bacterium]|nr:hypothetical protein [Chloroflexota bacterium]